MVTLRGFEHQQMVTLHLESEYLVTHGPVRHGGGGVGRGWGVARVARDPEMVERSKYPNQ